MIDWSRVAELRDEVGPEDFGEVVDLFLEEVDEVVERLRNKAVDGPLEEALHFLKGSSLNLGFATFSSLCRDGERAAADGHADSVDVSQIVESYDRSRKVFTDGVGSLGDYSTNSASA